MKHTHTSLLFSSLLLTFFSPSAAAEDITFNGDTSQLGTITVGGFAYSNSLFPKQSISGNTVTVLGGTADFVFGGISDSGGVMSGNTVNMYGGEIAKEIISGYSQSTSGTATANNNTVNMYGGEATGYITGGDSRSTSGTATTTGNTVNIHGGEVTGILSGGYSQSATDKATANNNTVNIHGGEVTGILSGGYSQSVTDKATANNNTVNIHGGKVTWSIIGGYSQSVTDKATANNNTVRIAEAASLGSTTSIYGGLASGSSDTFTGNTLNIAGKHRIFGLANFQHLNFTLPAGFTAGDTLITATNVSLGGTSTVTAIDSAGGTSLNVGDTVNLVSANTFSGAIANPGGTATGMEGWITLYDWKDIGINGNALTATLAGKRVNPQTHAFLQGRTASLSLLNQSGDLVAGTGMKSIRDTVSRGGSAFIAMQGGSSRYDTGSHVDIDSFSLMAGAAAGTRLAAADLYLGAFVETGTGSYNSYNAFTGMAAVRNRGNADYIGLGLSGEIVMDNGAYVNAAIRAGRINADLSSDLVPATASAPASYDQSGSLYAGAHLQGGWIMKLTDKDSIDAYARYVFTHMDSDTVTISGDRFRFDNSDSHRFRGGLRYAHDTGGLSPFVGIAYEYEADGKAEGTVAGWRIKPTDMGGSTFIGEAGLSWTPKSNGNVRLDLAIEGFAGQRDGVMGNLRFNYRF